MGMTPKELNVLLQRHGLFPDKQALMLLKEHVDQAADPKSEVAAVVQRIKSNTSRERTSPALRCAALPCTARMPPACSVAAVPFYLGLDVFRFRRRLSRRRQSVV